MAYESVIRIPSEAQPGVVFVIAKMSFRRRLDLMRQIRELGARLEFFAAGAREIDKIEGSVLSAEIDQLYFLWGLREIQGLEVDGAPATPETLAACGPETLFQEALAAVKAQCGLTEAERKN
jgi:hypothetical protein